MSKSLILSALTALMLLGTTAPAHAFQPTPSTHLTDAVPAGSIQFNPKVMVEAGVPTEDYGALAITRYLEITTLSLTGVSNTAVTLDYAGVTRHVNLVPNGVAVVVDFGPIASNYAAQGYAELLITYTSHRATGIMTDVRVATSPIAW